MFKLQKKKQLHYVLLIIGLVLFLSLIKLRNWRNSISKSSIADDDTDSDPAITAVENADSFLYFAYASDLLESRLHAGGGPSAKIVGVGRVKGMKFAFSQESKVWRGGVADIVPQEKAEVWGVLYRLKNTDLPTLNKQKGTDKADPLYEQIKVKVELKGTRGPQVDAISYSIVDSKRLPFDASPSPQYKECLLRGAEEQGLPSPYVESLRRIKDNGSTYRRKNVC